MQCFPSVSTIGNTTSMLKAMLHNAMSLMNLHVSRSGIKCIFICSQIGVTVS